ncbi:integrase core domain-containing protein [Vogesella sp. LYT5W]|uniref:Integrase core domain-containing protein n=1 Tax=Vogesella margarita TaxID=2984199 RepID=A0ABT5IRC8_9NEIS|nr:integrase core domain-containing protein [Vogesella margarita]MDC7715118.1 integrase core domain-containing protein [Vogesella margarita]
MKSCFAQWKGPALQGLSLCMDGTQTKQQAISVMQTSGLAPSERCACRFVGLSRDAWRHPPQADALTCQLTTRIVEIAQTRRHFGYRQVHELLRAEFPAINQKRGYRLYREQGLAVRRRNHPRKQICMWTPLQAATQLDEVWGMAFVSDQLASGRRLKCLTVPDDFCHEAVQIGVDFLLSDQYVTQMLDQVSQFRGYPLAVRTDDGPEFTSRVFGLGTDARHPAHSDSVGPADEERLRRKFQRQISRQVPDEHEFDTLAEARRIIAVWRDAYSQVHPHASTGRIPPAVFAARYRQQRTTELSSSTTTMQT